LDKWDQRQEKPECEQPRRGPAEQKIGGYYASCMNETDIDNKGITAIKPELDRIEALRNKTQLAETLAHIHSITFALATGTDSGSGAALFGFGSGQDLDDASRVVAVVDQGGLGLTGITT
jgi:putative endopeptidase